MVSNFFRVFVYGTLKRGEPNYHVITETSGLQKFLGCGKTKITFPLVISSIYNIPMLLNDPGNGMLINGEVYEVDNAKLAALDELEAYPTLYDRKEIPILMEDGNELTAWVYVMKTWRPDIYKVSSPMMDNYSTNGPHGRPYVERYARAKNILDDPSSNLYSEIKGVENDDLTRALTKQKALNDLQTTQA